MNSKEYTVDDYLAITQMMENSFEERKNGKSVEEIARQFTDKYPEDVVIAVMDTVIAGAAVVQQLGLKTPTDEMVEVMWRRGVAEMNKCLRKQENENVKN